VATYAIGDVQGCFDELQRLLTALQFDPGVDSLWFTGDLVNRGPESLAVLRFVHSLRDGAITVLGNHDLHLLACAWGDRKPHRHDTFAEVLSAPDREPLLQWLRRCPLLHYDPSRDCLLVHAGLPPQWGIEEARARASEVEHTLRGKHCYAFLRSMYGNEPDRWSEDLQGEERQRFITNCLTRMRFCARSGRVDLKSKGAPGTQPEKLLPWYAVPGRASRDTRVLFGHWATLHLGPAQTEDHNVVGLDTGCVWGGELTAMRLEDGRLFSVASHTRAANGD
jgi:bis(5'-nucleosyl)-tetraphosphatase (symmetrical)